MLFDKQIRKTAQLRAAQLVAATGSPGSRQLYEDQGFTIRRQIGWMGSLGFAMVMSWYFFPVGRAELPLTIVGSSLLLATSLLAARYTTDIRRDLAVSGHVSGPLWKTISLAQLSARMFVALWVSLICAGPIKLVLHGGVREAFACLVVCFLGIGGLSALFALEQSEKIGNPGVTA